VVVNIDSPATSYRQSLMMEINKLKNIFDVLLIKETDSTSAIS
jgi:hypothetical protein